MPFKKYFFILILCSLNGYSLRANDNQEKTAHSYDTFCSRGASESFDQLNKLTEADVQKINYLKNKINDLEAQKIIINGIKKIRSQYLKSIDSIKDFKENSNDQKLQLNNLKIISSIFKDSKLIDAFSPKKNCNQQYGICSNFTKENIKPEEISTIDGTVQNFSSAMEQIQNKVSMDIKINTLLAIIPEMLDPTKNIIFFNEKVPLLKDFFLNSKSKEIELSNSILLKDIQMTQTFLINSNKFVDRIQLSAQLHDQSSDDKNENAELLTKTNDLKEQLAKFLSDNTNLIKIEKIKKYITAKYLRQCPLENTANTHLISNIQLIKCSMLNEKNPDLDNIENLSINFSNILSKMQQGNTLSNKSNEKKILSHSELKEYQDACLDIPKSAGIANVCDEITKEYNTPEKAKIDWDKLHKKYWIKSAPDTKEGYIAFEKSSTGNIIGEGLKQSLNQFVPMWMGNYQLNNQINFMTDQAMYMKQVNYLNSTTSPWMNNSSYFQGNYFITPDSNFGTGMPTSSSQSGFNFSK